MTVRHSLALPLVILALAFTACADDGDGGGVDETTSGDGDGDGDGDTDTDGGDGDGDGDTDTDGGLEGCDLLVDQVACSQDPTCGYLEAPGAPNCHWQALVDAVPGTYIEAGGQQQDTGYRSELGLRILDDREVYQLRAGGFDGFGLCGFPAEPAFQRCELLDASVFQDCLAQGMGANCNPIDGGWTQNCQPADPPPDACE